MTTEKLALWMSQPHFGFLEIAHACGTRHLIVELEHGTFDLSTLDQFMAFARAMGQQTLCKVLAPTTEAIQQALDFGAHGVIIPHILGVDHAAQITRSAKYPPLGIRSYTGGRVYDYARPASDAFDRQNAERPCYAMIETAESLAEVEAIAELDTVDGLFPGPSDLALACGRGAYGFGDADRADLERIAAAARRAGKPWIMPAWTPSERAFARAEGADILIVATQNMTLRTGISSVLHAARHESP